MGIACHVVWVLEALEGAGMHTPSLLLSCGFETADVYVLSLVPLMALVLVT